MTPLRDELDAIHARARREQLWLALVVLAAYLCAFVATRWP